MQDYAASDTATLVYIDELSEALRPAKLRAIARAASAAREGGDYSINHIAAILGICKQSLHELMRKGQALLEAQRARLGVVVLRDRRRARLAAAGVPERQAIKKPARPAPGRSCYLLGCRSWASTQVVGGTTDAETSDEEYHLIT